MTKTTPKLDVAMLEQLIVDVNLMVAGAHGLGPPLPKVSKGFRWGVLAGASIMWIIFVVFGR